MERAYRKRVHSGRLISFRVVVKETDLWISADQLLEKETGDLVFRYRHQIEYYISRHPEFMTSLHPCHNDPYAPEIVREMIKATVDIGVGPMAAVAGAVAQYVGEGLLRHTDQVIVENGGDVFLKVNRPVTVALFAGNSVLSEKIGLVIDESRMPVGVCSSSGTVGHSLSRGVADAVCLVSSSALRADGAATALCNRIRSRKDLEHIADWASRIEGIDGGLAVMGDALASWGNIELAAV